MKILPICLKNSKNNLTKNSFTGETVYQKHKIIEKDILSLKEEKSFFSNPANPSLNILGIKLRPQNDSVQLVSRYNHVTGIIKSNPDVPQPKINVQAGAFQPMIEIRDDDLGITLLMTRGSELKGKNLSIDYKDITPEKISFKSNKLVISTGYKPDQTKQIVNNYQTFNKSYGVKRSVYAHLLKKNYTIMGLGGGYGTRLKPISDLSEASKIATEFPSANKSIFENSVLDTANRLRGVTRAEYIDDEGELSGTAGVIIKGLKNGTIPLDKPLVLLTGDTVNNIDLAKALYSYEQSDDCSIAMLVRKIDKKDVIGKSLVKTNNIFFTPGKFGTTPAARITGFSQIITPSNFNKIDIDDYNSKYPNGSNGITEGLYTSTNIMVIAPEALKVLKDFGDEHDNADFMDFFGFMYNLGNPYTRLTELYPDGLKSNKLSLSQFMDETKKTKNIKSAKGKELYVQAIVAEGINHSKDAISEDLGTVEEYIKFTRNVQNGKYTRDSFHDAFIDQIKSSLSGDVICLNADAKNRLEELKKKYNINDINGNVIAYATKKKQIDQPRLITPSSINEVSVDENFILNTTKDLSSSKKTTNSLIDKYGLPQFLEWYISEDGFYGKYEEFLYDKYAKSKSVDELLKYQPNWTPWKLEEKAFAIKHDLLSSSEDYVKTLFQDYCSKTREFPFVIGDLPEDFGDLSQFRNLVNTLKTQDIKEKNEYINNKYSTLKRLKGGELNDKFIYSCDIGGKKYILKFDRINAEDFDIVDGRKLSELEKRSVRKNKYLAGDSIYTDACVNRYLELNGCNCIPHLYFYDHQTHSAIYEFIEGKEADSFQEGKIDEEYVGLDVINNHYKELTQLGIHLNDSAVKNTLIDDKGNAMMIDLGHCSFIQAFKPGVKKYTYELSNINGPDVRNFYSGVLLNMMKD